MKESNGGWVVVNHSHPAGIKPYIVNSTFRYTRRGSIASFIQGSGNSWKYWYQKYNFRCVKAMSTIELILKP